MQEFEDKQVTLQSIQSPASLSKAMSPHSLVPAGPPTLFLSTSTGEVPKRTETYGSKLKPRKEQYWNISLEGQSFNFEKEDPGHPRSAATGVCDPPLFTSRPSVFQFQNPVQGDSEQPKLGQGVVAREGKSCYMDMVGKSSCSVALREEITGAWEVISIHSENDYEFKAKSPENPG